MQWYFTVKKTAVNESFVYQKFRQRHEKNVKDTKCFSFQIPIFRRTNSKQKMQKKIANISIQVSLKFFLGRRCCSTGGLFRSLAWDRLPKKSLANYNFKKKERLKIMFAFLRNFYDVWQCFKFRINSSLHFSGSTTHFIDRSLLHVAHETAILIRKQINRNNELYPLIGVLSGFTAIFKGLERRKAHKLWY